MLQILPPLLTLFIFPFILEEIQKLTYRFEMGNSKLLRDDICPGQLKKRYFEGRQCLGKVKDLDKTLTVLSVLLVFLPRESIQAAP